MRDSWNKNIRVSEGLKDSDNSGIGELNKIEFIKDVMVGFGG